MTVQEFGPHNGRVPEVAIEGVTTVRASAILTATYVPSLILDVRGAREVTLLIKATGGSADNAVSILALLAANQASVPKASDDVWYGAAVTDGAVTPAVLDATVYASATFTVDPEWGSVVVRPMEILLAEMDAASDIIEMAVTIKCAWAAYLHLQCADTDAAGTLATLEVKAVRSL